MLLAKIAAQESQLAELTDSASLAGARKPRTVTEVFDGIRLQDAKLNRELKQLLPNLDIDTPAPVYTPNPNRVRLGEPGFEEQRNADRDAIAEIGNMDVFRAGLTAYIEPPVPQRPTPFPTQQVIEMVRSSVKPKPIPDLTTGVFEPVMSRPAVQPSYAPSVPVRERRERIVAQVVNSSCWEELKPAFPLHSECDSDKSACSDKSALSDKSARSDKSSRSNKSARSDKSARSEKTELSSLSDATLDEQVSESFSSSVVRARRKQNLSQ